MQVVGIDAGGTFTDTVVICETGRIGVGKALSTPGHLEDGVINSLLNAAQILSLDLETLLSQSDIVAHGTTTGLNALLTGTGAKVGLVTTSGFESTLAIAKSNKIHGLDEHQYSRATTWDKPTLLVPRHRTRGAKGRIDLHGREIEEFDEDQARSVLLELKELGCEAIAISLLWSSANPTHEVRLAELVSEIMPDVTVSVSHRVVPRIGEYERTATTVIDAYISPLVTGYITTLEQRLHDLGFAGLFAMLRMGGGILPAKVAQMRPIETLHSGPVGGVSGAALLGHQIGDSNVITTDVGGTSFDVGLVSNGDVLYSARPMIERHALAIPVVDVASIGTGGGSIAYFDPSLKVLRVGPTSAGAQPGPACYGRGGDRATLTDASVVLGYLDRLSATVSLDLEKAKAVVRKDVAEPLGLSLYEAAEGVVSVACAQMHDLIRRATIQRGFDPSDFSLYAFGGAGPQYVSRFSLGLGVKNVIIPALAPVFSAFGAAGSIVSVFSERDLVPRPLDWDIDALNDLFAEMETEGEAQLARGVARSSLANSPFRIRRFVGLRFFRQLNRIDIELDNGSLDIERLHDAHTQFRDFYERLVGKGSAHSETPIELVSVQTSVTISLQTKLAPRQASSASQPIRTRIAYFDGSEIRVPIYEWATLSPTQEICGPVFIESPQTTVVVSEQHSVHCDAYGNLYLTEKP